MKQNDSGLEKVCHVVLLFATYKTQKIRYFEFSGLVNKHQYVSQLFRCFQEPSLRHPFQATIRVSLNSIPSLPPSRNLPCVH